MPKVSVDQLKTAARQRWGTAWTIRTLRFADDSVERYVYHTYGKSKGLVDRGRLLPTDDGSITYERVLLSPMKVTQTLEHESEVNHATEAD